MQVDHIYFYTATIKDWIPVLNTDSNKDIILNSLQYLKENKHVIIYGYVIMPNHIHLIWKPLTKNVQLRFMKFTGQQIKFSLLNNKSPQLERFLVNERDRIFRIWQRNSYAFELFKRKTCEQKLHYIHSNPLQKRWRLVDDPVRYKYSSASFYELGTPDDILTHYGEEFI